jgi:glycosyltransferase involved in cell wall biosynthesis
MTQTNLPFISIVTVVKDDFANFVLTAVSLSRQSEPNFEWVVVDGSSDQQVSGYLEQMDHQFALVYQHLEPKGIYNAMNVGVKISNSSWIWILNAGDFLLTPDAISKMSSLIQDSKADLIASQVINLSTSGYMVSISKPETIDVNGYKIAKFNHQGVVMLKKNLEKLGFFDESFKFAADGKLLDQAIRDFTFHCTDHAFVAFQLGGASSQNYRTTIREILEYRPAIKRRLANVKSLMRNFARLRLLKSERTHFLNWFSTLYFKNREIKLHSELLNLRVIHTSECPSKCSILRHVNEPCYQILRDIVSSVPRNRLS